MRKKRVLILNDELGAYDIIETYNEVYSESGMYDGNMQFEYIGFTYMKFLSTVDVVLVDYGMIGNFEESVHILQQFYAAGIPIFWMGGLSCNEYYEHDCLRMFPRIKFMHQIKSISLRDFHVSLERYFTGTDDYNYTWVKL